MGREEINQFEARLYIYCDATLKSVPDGKQRKNLQQQDQDEDEEEDIPKSG